jgi:hypothetical protein
MTIHWKAPEEHFLMVPFIFRFIHFLEENEFWGEMIFLKKPRLYGVKLEPDQEWLLCLSYNLATRTKSCLHKYPTLPFTVQLGVLH